MYYQASLIEFFFFLARYIYAVKVICDLVFTQRKTQASIKIVARFVHDVSISQMKLENVIRGSPKINLTSHLRHASLPLRQTKSIIQKIKIKTHRTQPGKFL